MVEKGLKWLAAFVFPKHYSDVQEENENLKEFIIYSTSSSSRIPEILLSSADVAKKLQKYCQIWKLLFQSCNSRNAIKLRYYQVGNSRDTDKVRNFYVRHFKNTVKFCAEQC